MTDWLARAQIVAMELAEKYPQIDGVLADSAAQEAVMLYELSPKLRKFDFDGWICYRVWTAYMLDKQQGVPAGEQTVRAENSVSDTDLPDVDLDSADKEPLQMPKDESADNEKGEKKMAKGIRIDEDIVKALCDDVAAGMSIPKAAKKYGLGLTTAYRFVRSAGAVGNGSTEDKSAADDRALCISSTLEQEQPHDTSGGDINAECSDGGKFVFAERTEDTDRQRLTDEITACVTAGSAISDNISECCDTAAKMQRSESAFTAATDPGSEKAEGAAPYLMQDIGMDIQRLAMEIADKILRSVPEPCRFEFTVEGGFIYIAADSNDEQFSLKRRL